MGTFFSILLPQTYSLFVDRFTLALRQNVEAVTGGKPADAYFEQCNTDYKKAVE